MKHLMHGMTVKQWETLRKMMNTEPPTPSRVHTYREMLEMGKIKIDSFRVSKQGVKLVKFSNGKEVELDRIERTNCYMV